MNVVITGAAGFLGDQVTNVLLGERSPLPVARLLLVDLDKPRPRADPRVSTLSVNLADHSSAELIISPDCDVVFHLAAVVSGQAETDFDLGLRVNFDTTRALVETARLRRSALRFVFTSTVAVYGGELPPAIDEMTAVTPQTSYGAEKAMTELLLNEYGRRGFVDTRIIRLPTVSVRTSAANQAVTSFASGIIREPLNGKASICPVDVEQKLWLTSVSTVAQNIVHAATLTADVLIPWRVINLPGICVSVGEMVAALREVGGAEAASLVHFKRDETIARMVASLPSRLNNERALRLGFATDVSFAEVIRKYIDEKQ